MARIRTINEVLTLMKEADKETSITYNFIKQLCINGDVPSYMVGNRILLNYELFNKYLDGE